MTSGNKVQCLAEALEQRILAAEWVPGNRLPAQQRLMAEFGVARTTLREALGLLQERGVLRTQHGSGSYVNNLFEASFLPPLNQLSMTDPQAQVAVLEMRQVLEGEAAFYACLRATDVELAAIDEEYQRMLARAASLPVLERAKADLTFHMLIAEASHNLWVVSLSQLLYSKMFNTIFAALSGGMLEQAGNMEAVENQHRDIHTAILKRDANGAKQAAQIHAWHTALMCQQLRRNKED
ncbi:MAG TPA: FadR family transcriptional regulator [Oceanospirillaceae bacterium]|nr:FadR family transcriptional regulator [Oceanospirillaceae bacterium]